MCLIGLAIDVPGPWLLVVAANRDEFHDRHAAPAAYWERSDERSAGHGAAEAGGVLAGRDLQGGGTWFGVRRSARDGSLRVAALTNLRPGLMPTPAVLPTPDRSQDVPGHGAVPPSRGQLVSAFLQAESAPAAFLQGLQPPPDAYAGFNLLALVLHAGSAAAAVPDAWYLNNLPGSAGRALGSGVHLLSNATIDVAWPKTGRLERALTRALDESGNDVSRLCESLFCALSDRTPAAVRELPQTGLDTAREHLLSAPFIADDHYGTRCSTVLVVSRSGEAMFLERSFGPGGRVLGTVRERIGARPGPYGRYL